MRAKITDSLLRSLDLPAGSSQLVVHDTLIPGFGACLGRRGWTFTVDYRTPDGRRVRGEVLDAWGVITVYQARERARDRLAEVRLTPTVDELDPTFAELVDHFLTYSERRRRSYRQDRYRVKRSLDGWRQRKALSIGRSDVARLMRQIGERGGSPIEANRVGGLIRRIYYLAEDDELIARGHNPAARLRSLVYPETPKHDRSATPEEVARIHRALLRSSPGLRATIWTLLLTGLRRTEASHLRWAEVNLGEADIVLPGRRRLAPGCLYVPRTKSGRPHTLPISQPLRQLLTSLDRPSAWVFPGRWPDQPLTKLDHGWRTVRVRAGCPELTIHDLRATVASWMARAGEQDRVIAQVLNHATPGVVLSRYIDDMPERVADALERHGQAVIEAAGVTTGAALLSPQPTTVVRIFGKAT